MGRRYWPRINGVLIRSMSRGAIIRRKKINALRELRDSICDVRKVIRRTKLQQPISLLDRPHRAHHESRNMVAHATRLRTPGGVRPYGLRRCCTAGLPVAAIVRMVASGFGLTLVLGLALLLR